MQANPDKFQAIAVKRGTNSICDNQISNWCREIFKYNTVIS
jgi:hypothetical protein